MPRQRLRSILDSWHSPSVSLVGDETVVEQEAPRRPSWLRPTSTQDEVKLVVAPSTKTAAKRRHASQNRGREFIVRNAYCVLRIARSIPEVEIGDFRISNERVR